MNNKLSKAMVTFVVAMLLVGVLPVFALPSWMPTQDNAIFLDPPSISLDTANPEHTIGYKFRVTVWVKWTTLAEDASLIVVWQLKLYFNPEYLEVTGYGRTGPGGTVSELFAGQNVFAPDPIINNVAGFVAHGETILGAGGRTVPVTASLCWIEFSVKKVPGKGETLTAAFNVANSMTFLGDEDENYYYGTDYGIDGTYEFVWSPPAPAYMSIEPTSKVYGPWPPSAVGQTFDANIYVNVAAAWGLTSASFCLCFNDTVIDTSDADITIDPAWTGTAVLTETPAPEELARIDFNVAPVGSVGGKVLVATVKFTVIHQETVPPAPKEWADVSPLDLCEVEMQNHIGPITVGPSVNGKVEVNALRTVPMPWLEVSPTSIVYGPDLALGEEFDVKIIIKNLSPLSQLIAYQVRVGYNPTLLQVVSVSEGGFLTDPRWNLHGTYFISRVTSFPPYGPHVIFGDILLPNATGYWDMTNWPLAPGPDVDPIWPPVDTVLATIRFRVIYQGLLEPKSCGIDILPATGEGNHFVDVNGEYIDEAVDLTVNGVYTILPKAPVGRAIDLYGGANNMGYGSSPFPEPYGGQGPNADMDLVIPQSMVCLYAKVTYNDYPVQSKLVSFEVEGPGFIKPVKFTSLSNSDGIAKVCFRMPWPCEDPERTLGTYTVTATVNIADEIVSDTMSFNYDYLVRIIKVTTDKYEYAHGEYVRVTIEYEYNAEQDYPVLFYAVIQDELGVPIGQAVVPASGGTGSVSIYIPKWAFAGIATVTVNVYDKDPTEGGAAWCPPASSQFYIAAG